MDDQAIPGPEPEEPQPSSEPGAEPAPAQTSGPASAPGEPVWRPRGPRILRPWEALKQLDRQWEERTPLRELGRQVSSLTLTTADDPRGWDYLGALTGDPPHQTARACEAWLEAQLAADAVALGRAARPRVELVPAGRLWYVVRTIADAILIIDGPGYPTPFAAVMAAFRRYHAELLRELGESRTGEGESPEADEGRLPGGDTDDQDADEEPAGAEPDEAPPPADSAD